MAAPVHLVLIYPALLGIYGDRGNAAVLEWRLAQRGIGCRLSIIELGDRVPDDAQVYLLGGGEDAAQVSASRALSRDAGLRRGVERGAAVLAVCAGYQIAGRSFTVDTDHGPIEGLGLLDVSSQRADQRAVGEILTRWIDPPPGISGDDQLISGFENHGGRTSLGPDARPLAAVEVGIGNGTYRTEGAVSGNVIGTYLHGPVLARNSALADHLLAIGLQSELAPLALPEVSELHRQRISAARR